ncbi:hypothetical protein AB0M95_40520 [Sphaerisporangium sp. NPDC051017]|uniref:hypothetical protein n=1 Tax=unclassified Sphaerisporangium TaxID=2630420 RepID=UPI00340831EA
MNSGEPVTATLATAGPVSATRAATDVENLKTIARELGSSLKVNLREPEPVEGRALLASPKFQTPELQILGGDQAIWATVVIRDFPDTQDVTFFVVSRMDVNVVPIRWPLREVGEVVSFLRGREVIRQRQAQFL